MNSKTTISITEARNRIFDIADEVQKPGVYYTFTENGRPKAVLMSAEEFDSLMEDIELASDPGFAKRMAEVEKEYERGEYVSWEEAKKELGWDKLEPSMVMEKAKQAYGAKAKTKKRKK